jgi:hypothetical protein
LSARLGRQMIGGKKGTPRPVTSREVFMAGPPEGMITDQALDHAIERKRDQLISEIGSRISGLIKKFLPPTTETHWLNDPSRIPQSERAAFLKDLEAL